MRGVRGLCALMLAAALALLPAAQAAAPAQTALPAAQATDLYEKEAPPVDEPSDEPADEPADESGDEQAPSQPEDTGDGQTLPPEDAGEEQAPPPPQKDADEEQAPPPPAEDTGDESLGGQPVTQTPPGGASIGEEQRPAGQSGGASLRERLFWPLAALAAALVLVVLWLVWDRRRRSARAGAPQAAVPTTKQPAAAANAAAASAAAYAPRYQVGNLHNIGRRAEQQDSFCVCDIRDAAAILQKGMLAVVADGMGGLEGGAVISQTVTDVFLSAYRRLAVPDPDAFLYDCTLRAQAAVRRYMEQSGISGGSTLVAVLLRDGLLHYISVGDSRIYLVHGGELVRVNQAHNYAAVLREQAARGEVPSDEPYTNPRRDALTSYLGIETLTQIDRSETPIRLSAGDRVMLCSDGVFNALGDEALRTALAAPAADAAAAMEEAVLAQHIDKQDNFTAVVVEVEVP